MGNSEIMLVEDLLNKATLGVPKMKQVAKLYNLPAAYQNATRDTNKRAFIKALFAKLK